MVGAGKLINRITITRPATLAQNSYGESTAADVELDTVWGEILPIAVKEINIAKGFGSTVNHKITIRWRDDLSSTYRITLGNRNFNINGFVDPDGLRRDLVIYATEVLS